MIRSKISILILIFHLISLAGWIKCLMLFSKNSYSDIFFWLGGTAWVTWVVFSLQLNRDLPAVGPFGYKDGTNQEARIIYTVCLLGIFLFAIIFSD
jgi:hypothetical protein